MILWQIITFNWLHKYFYNEPKCKLQLTLTVGEFLFAVQSADDETIRELEIIH